jgi:hypothetical protein
MSCIFLAYVIATPFAIWMELKTERDDCIEERLRRKASDGFKSVAWMFDSGFAVWHMFWAILIGPLVVGFLVAAFVFVFPVVLVADLVFGVDLMKDEKQESTNTDDMQAVG